MTIEFWDLLDKNGNFLGEVYPRGSQLPKEKYHKCIDAWLFNNKGEILLTQRSLNKNTFPGYWEPTGGAVLAGEQSINAALREVKEELGIDLEKADGVLLDTHHRDWKDDLNYNDIVDVWIFPFNENVDLDQAETTEVKSVKWVNYEEFNKLQKSRKLVDNLDYFQELILPYVKEKIEEQ